MRCLGTTPATSIEDEAFNLFIDKKYWQKKGSCLIRHLGGSLLMVEQLSPNEWGFEISGSAVAGIHPFPTEEEAIRQCYIHWRGVVLRQLLLMNRDSI